MCLCKPHGSLYCIEILSSCVHDVQAIPGLGHGIDAKELSALQRWMKERLWKRAHIFNYPSASREMDSGVRWRFHRKTYRSRYGLLELSSLSKSLILTTISELQIIVTHAELSFQVYFATGFEPRTWWFCFDLCTCIWSLLQTHALNHLKKKSTLLLRNIPSTKHSTIYFFWLLLFNRLSGLVFSESMMDMF